MNGRTTVGLLFLTLSLAACGSQSNAPGEMAPVAANAAQDVTLGADTASERSRTEAPLLGTANPEAIEGQYIVVLSQGAGRMTAQALESQSAGGLIRSLGLDPQGVSVQNIYSQALNGFSARLSAQNLSRLQTNPDVKYIEQDGVMHATATQSGATWGLDRTDQRNMPLDSSYTYSTTASGVRAYIIDTGINTSHTNFGGRAVWGTNTTGDGNNSDCQGHGTHVAGTVGSATWGVAKGVQLVAVKVLDCSGSGSNSGVIAGVNWALNNKSGPAVANMSLGGGFSQAVNDAVNNAAARDLVMVVAGGNENQNACNVSPASAANAITVGATTNTDARASYSNYGSCLDLFAPGSNITSTWIGSNTATNTISGTSMASPHVAGAAALILAGNTGASTATVTSTLLNNTTPNKVTGANTGSPNKLLFTGAAGGTTPPPPPPPAAGTTTYTGSVGSRKSVYSNAFNDAGGNIRGVLSGPSGTDFDLFLQKQSGGRWVDVAASEGSGSNETVSYNAGSGTYRWEIYSYQGSGSFTLTETR
ncbi:S8 family peptidase [Deinococcus marmoris]|uniref:S8 family peptidase n=1 Tax=Deinococcus marmoris TaxID=249408 RepID=UPI000497E79A|nr:S8 family peptidase [Deinococcus marmoris]